MPLISTSILGIKDDLEKIKLIDDTDTDYLHLDIMDGEFVPNKTFTIKEIGIISKNTNKPKDIHLMVTNPLIYIERIYKFKPEIITFHLECFDNINKVIKEIKKKKIKVGISIKPSTKIEDLYPYISKIDLILVMSVEPGFGGQPFIEESLGRIKKLKKYIKENKLNTLIEVDGGINNITSKLCIKNGIDILIGGSYITKYKNYQDRINKIRW